MYNKDLIQVFKYQQALIDLEEIISSENFDPRKLFLNLEVMWKNVDDLIERVKQIWNDTDGLIEKIKHTKNNPQYSRSIFDNYPTWSLYTEPYDFWPMFFALFVVGLTIISFLFWLSL